MSSNPRKTRKESKRAPVSNEANPDESEHEKDDPQDAEPPSVQEQISRLTATISNHSESLKALKDVPMILSHLSKSLGIDDNESEPEGDENSGADLDEGDLLADFEMIDHEEGQEAKTVTEEDDTDLLEILEVTQPSSDYGEKIHDKVANSFSRMVKNHPTKEKSDQWKELFKPPENCKELGVPRVNPEIWPQLKPASRHKDLALQQHGSYISQASVAVSKIAHLIFSSGKQIPKEIGKSLLNLSMDAGSILGLASQELSAKRKAELKPNLNREFIGICSNKTPTTEWLFGDNVMDQLKASKSAANVMKPAFANFGKSVRFHPFKNQPNLNYKKPPFQQKGGNYQNRQSRPFQAKQHFQQTPQQHRRQN